MPEGPAQNFVLEINTKQQEGSNATWPFGMAGNLNSIALVPRFLFFVYVDNENVSHRLGGWVAGDHAPCLPAP